MSGYDASYNRNPLLKKANTKLEFTEEQVLEFARCSNDPIYFAENYMKIVTLDYGLQPFTLYPFQKRMLSSFHTNRFNICKLPRQSGKCFYINTIVKVRNKLTGEIIELPIGELYEKIKKESDSDLS
jgi:hypothetical protein